jgi:hypothetical protein
MESVYLLLYCIMCRCSSLELVRIVARYYI